MKVKDLRNKIFFTLAIIALYRVGSFIPVPGIPFAELVDSFKGTEDGAGAALLMLNLFSGGALEYFSVFSLGIMPYITASIIMQLMQGVIPALTRWAKEGESGQRKITRITRYLTLILGLINAVGYLMLFQSPQFGISFANNGLPTWLTSIIIVVTLVAGTAFIMWMGELITQRGIGNGMSLIACFLVCRCRASAQPISATGCQSVCTHCRAPPGCGRNCFCVPFRCVSPRCRGL